MIARFPRSALAKFEARPPRARRRRLDLIHAATAKSFEVRRCSKAKVLPAFKSELKEDAIRIIRELRPATVVGQRAPGQEYRAACPVAHFIEAAPSSAIIDDVGAEPIIVPSGFGFDIVHGGEIHIGRFAPMDRKARK